MEPSREEINRTIAFYDGEENFIGDIHKCGQCGCRRLAVLDAKGGTWFIPDYCDVLGYKVAKLCYDAIKLDRV